MVNWHQNTHPTRAGGEHIPSQPLWIAIIRGIQGLFSLLVLALAANAASDLYLDGYGMAIFTFIWTVLFLLYIFLAPRFMPNLYYFWAHVALEVLTVIWWLVTFALLAHYTRLMSGRYYYGYWRSGFADSTRAATAFAILNWILFCVTLAAILLLSRRATVDGAHTHTVSTPSTSPNTRPTSSFGAKFSALFSHKPRTADPEAKHGTATELSNNGPVNNTDGPVGTSDYGAPYGAGSGHNNAAAGGADYGQHWQGTAPPIASAPHYGGQERV